MVTDSIVPRVLRLIFFVTFAAFCALLLFLPPARTVGASGESYLCLWEDGSETTESYASAYSCLETAEENALYLVRDGVRGRVEAGAEYRRVYHVLCEGTLAQLLSLSLGEISALEQTALWRRFSHTVWYDGESFIWNGERIERGERRSEVVVLMTGALPKAYLKETGASTLVIRADASISASDFAGSAVQTVEAEAPYLFSGGALYLNTAGGTRLLAALPQLTELTVDENASFFDEGALTPCTQLCSLTVPFAGNAAGTNGSAYLPYLGCLFLNDEGYYAVPETLKRVRVTGGVIASNSFYGCGSVEVIDVSAVPKENVARDAFLGCTSLRILYTRNDEVRLSGDFVSRREGDVTVYERV